MKRVIAEIFLFVIVAIGVIFSISYMLNGSIGSGKGLFGGIGSSLEESMDVAESDRITYTASTSDAPIAVYNSSSQTIGTNVPFKSLFTVITENGTKNGAVEDDFAIYLKDIRDASNNSVLLFLSTEEIEGLEEIPAKFIYDKETDQLYFNGIGTYDVIFNIYGSNGGMATYEFALPVELN